MNRSGACGFSLLETILFLVVISITMGGLFGLFTHALQTAYEPARMTVALLLARERMEEIFALRVQSYDKFLNNRATFKDEQPVAGTPPLHFPDMNRSTQFTKGELLQNGAVQCTAEPLPSTPLIVCITVTVSNSATGSTLATIRSVVARHE